MNHKQKHTLDDILKKPASGNVHWRDVESLLEALGAELQVTHGARMTFMLQGVTGTLHKSHHSSVLTKQDIRHLRDFLHNVGFKR
jgi:hypothetical protein